MQGMILLEDTISLERAFQSLKGLFKISELCCQVLLHPGNSINDIDKIANWGNFLVFI